ncbi:MAG: SH3 domain-containing protein, partial [Treponema sp.]|nr:SH3 domain-containing protein [Treponema sp.]
LIKTNTCDLTNVPWPRRADGTMDYPPPLDMSHYLPTHRTLDNLRLRGTANTASKIVTTMPRGTEVQLIETGPVTVIDNITAPWVKVMTANGYAGWCFSGYLEAVQPQPNEIIVNAPDAAYETARLEGNQNIIPGEKDFPAVFVAGIVAGIICVAVLAGIIFVAVFILTVILKKRKR